MTISQKRAWIEMTKEIKLAWEAYRQADPDHDRAEWQAFTGACADAGVFVVDAINELCP